MGPIRDGTSGRRLSATAVTRGVSSCDNRHTWMTCIFVKRKALTKLDSLTLYAIRISLLTPPEAARAAPSIPRKIPTCFTVESGAYIFRLSINSCIACALCYRRPCCRATMCDSMWIRLPQTHRYLMFGINPEYTGRHHRPRVPTAARITSERSWPPCPRPRPNLLLPVVFKPPSRRRRRRRRPMVM